MVDVNVYAILAKVAYAQENQIENNLKELFFEVYNTRDSHWEVLEVNGKYKTSYLSGFDGMAFGLDANGDGIY